MKKTGVGFSMTLAAFALAALAMAQDAPKQPSSASATTAPAPPPVVPEARATTQPTQVSYVLPRRGAPRKRKIGGSRTSETESITIAALAPDHEGLTTKAQPSLFWYISKPTDKPVEIAFTRGEEIDPVLEFRLDRVKEGGVQRIDLSAHKIELQPGASYEWVVAIVVDNDRRSKDIVTSAFIRRVSSPRSLSTELVRAGEDWHRAAAAYASTAGDPKTEQGIWYDAMEVLCNLAEQHPPDAAAQAERSGLLRQVGLNEAADALAPRRGS